MKITIATFLAAITLTLNCFAQNVGINATGATPDNSALLDLSSTDKGFLITRADTGAISSPAFGLMTLAPIDSCLYLYNGISWITIGGVGFDCSCSDGTPESTCGKDNVTQVIEVISGDGRIWMDRNLGATQAATSSTDEDAYGGLYQWGRCSDGHEKRNSGTNATRSSTDNPGHGDFITMSLAPINWRDPPNINLWQGVAGINNPCPTGFRLPTKPEFEAEIASWSSSNSAGAFASPLKLSAGGDRNIVSGTLTNNSVTNPGNAYGYYWTSSITSGYMNMLRFHNTQALVGSENPAYGKSVRCIKD